MSYLLRLADVSLASFFVLHAALTLLALSLSPGAIRRAQFMRAATGARLLLVLRVLPSVVALLAVALGCIPSYLRFEQDGMESISPACTLLALCGLLTLVTGMARLLWGITLSARMNADRARWSSATNSPIFALVGFLRPRVVVSNIIRQALSSAQMEAALRHEAAHSHSADNLKRLAILAAPALPFPHSFRSLESQWMRLAEWAADDAASAGEPRRAIALAEALLCVARLAGQTECPSIVSSLVASQDDLGQRVRRLLAQQNPTVADPRNRFASMVAAAALLCAAALMASQQRQLLLLVHSAMERLAH